MAKKQPMESDPPRFVAFDDDGLVPLLSPRAAEMRERCYRAFERRFGQMEPLSFAEVGHNRTRVSHAPTRAWVDFDISAHRIRAVGWNGPEPINT